MVNIKASQAKIISDYASSCMNDVQDCFNEQNSQITSWSTSASVDNVYRVMKGACYNVALTCGYAVFAYDVKMGEETCKQWKAENVCNTGTTPPSTDYCAYTDDDGTAMYCDLSKVSDTQKAAVQSKQEGVLIEGISDLFAQSLLCPVNSTFQKLEDGSSGTADINRTIAGWVNSMCKCNDGYSVWEATCKVSCTSDQYRNNSGLCTSTCSNGGSPAGGEENKTENRWCAETETTDNENSGGNSGYESEVKTDNSSWDASSGDDD